MEKCAIISFSTYRNSNSTYLRDMQRAAWYIQSQDGTPAFCIPCFSKSRCEQYFVFRLERVRGALDTVCRTAKAPDLKTKMKTKGNITLFYDCTCKRLCSWSYTVLKPSDTYLRPSAPDSYITRLLLFTILARCSTAFLRLLSHRRTRGFRRMQQDFYRDISKFFLAGYII